jgi:hypothetical protein
MKNPRTILEALGYWLNFELSCKREELFSERHMSYPIGQFLIARYGHAVRTEFEHPILSTKSSGNKPKIDFVVVEDSEIELAIETKWVSKSNTLDVDICRDLIRLSLLVDEYNCSAFLIIAGKKEKIISLFKKTNLSFFPTNKDDLTGRLELLKSFKNGDKFTKRILKKFHSFEIPNSIAIKKISNFELGLRGSQFPVYGWRVMKTKVKKFEIKSA